MSSDEIFSKTNYFAFRINIDISGYEPFWMRLLWRGLLSRVLSWTLLSSLLWLLLPSSL